MSAFGANAYKSVAVETGVGAGDPHQLVLMLYDGAIAACREAFGHMKAGRIREKGAAIGKAIRIIEEGLRISLDVKAGGQLAQRLNELYEFMTMRLLQANLRNDASGLVQVAALLDDLRAAWVQIGKKPAADSAAAAPVPAAAAGASGPAPGVPAAPAGSPLARFAGADAAPARRVAAWA